MITGGKYQIFKPNPKYCMTSILKEIELASHTQTLKDEKWKGSMGDEFNAMNKNHMWNLVNRRMAKNIVGNKWKFQIKRLPDGSIERYKSRLVVKGFHQRPDLDYHETFSPMIKYATIRLVLGTTVGKGWPLRQIHVNNAFLQGHLTNDVYMTQPPCFIDKDRQNHVCRLNNAIYGLKQSPRT